MTLEFILLCHRKDTGFKFDEEVSRCLLQLNFRLPVPITGPAKPQIPRHPCRKSSELNTKLGNKIPEGKQKYHHSDIPMGHGIPVGEIESDVSRQGYKSCNDAGMHPLHSTVKTANSEPTASAVD